MALDNILYIILITLIPWIELRGSIPYSILVLQLDPLFVFLIAIAANILIIIPVFIVLHFLFDFFAEIPFIERRLEKLHKKTHKHVERYGFWALALFVAVPFPGTGAYAGSLLTYVFDMPKKKAFLAIALGVIIAGILVTLISLGLLGSLAFLGI